MEPGMVARAFYFQRICTYCVAALKTKSNVQGTSAQGAPRTIVQTQRLPLGCRFIAKTPSNCTALPLSRATSAAEGTHKTKLAHREGKDRDATRIRRAEDGKIREEMRMSTQPPPAQQVRRNTLFWGCMLTMFKECVQGRLELKRWH